MVLLTIFIIALMSTTNGEKDSLLGQTVFPPELGQILGGLLFMTTLYVE